MNSLYNLSAHKVPYLPGNDLIGKENYDEKKSYSRDFIITDGGLSYDRLRWKRSSRAVMPSSSRTSRTTASSTVSPLST